MKVHKASVRDRRIEWDDRLVVRMGVESDAVELDLDAEWLGCDRVQAVLACGNATVRVLPVGGRFSIPSQMMSAAGPLRTCLVGYAGGTQRIVTAREERPLTVVECGQMGGADPAPEKPDLWDSLMAEVEAAAAEARGAARDLRDAAARGEFDGAPGPAGPRGASIRAHPSAPGDASGMGPGDLYINSETGELFELVEY